MFTVDYWREALNRAWRTFFQTIVAGGAVQLVTDDWGAALATAGIAAAFAVIQYFADPPNQFETAFDPDVDELDLVEEVEIVEEPGILPPVDNRTELDPIEPGEIDDPELVEGQANG